MEPEALRAFRALVERVGGRQHLLLVGEARAGELETFARDLFAEPAKDEPPAAPPQPQPQPQEEPAAPAARRARVRGGGRPWRGCPLLFALFRAGSLGQPRECRRLREILRDVRSQLPVGPLAAVVGVVLLPPPASPSERGGGGGAEAAAAEAARLRLEALLRRVFRERRHPRPGLPDTLQAVAYRPGDAQTAAAAREAACRALRAALKLRAESQKQKLPAFLWCIPWGRRDEHFHTDAKSNEDALQDIEEAIALTNIAPNGNCEEASGGLDS
ncbi:uncharacterized protein C2orf72 homolog [Candoia aspera]|uniref:uncharacterized protein C2orf72 homolog n=1 Tax=Candoia aspera TaxID=51853 RepID=UPI002FD82A90